MHKPQILQTSCTAKKSDQTVVREADTTRSFINRIHKCQATFSGHMMRREKMENLETTGMIYIRKMQQGETARK